MLINAGKVRRRAGAVMLSAVALFGAFVFGGGETLHVFARNTAVLSAAIMLPEGSLSVLAEIWADRTEVTVKSASFSGLPEADNETDIEDMKTSPVALEPENTAEHTDPPPDIPPNKTGKVIEQKFGNAGLNFQDVWVSSKVKNNTVSVQTELERPLDFKILKNGKPQVLIVHTHTTESYMDVFDGAYDPNFPSRSRDASKNMIAVGEAIAKELNDAGYMAVQIKNEHDYPSYNGAYDRSRASISAMLKKYPSIDVVIDVHRDAIMRDNGDKIKPTAVIDGKKAAQIMIISGCDDNKKLGYPDWEQNLRFSVRVQQSMSKLYPGLARPVLFSEKKYNQDMKHGSFLVEMGSDSNTLEEALYSGQLFGKALVDTFDTCFG